MGFPSCMSRGAPVSQPVIAPVAPPTGPVGGPLSCGEVDVLDATRITIANCGAGQRCTARNVISTCTGERTQCCSRLISTCIEATYIASHEISTCLVGATSCATRHYVLGQVPKLS